MTIGRQESDEETRWVFPGPQGARESLGAAQEALTLYFAASKGVSNRLAAFFAGFAVNVAGAAMRADRTGEPVGLESLAELGTGVKPRPLTDAVADGSIPQHIFDAIQAVVGERAPGDPPALVVLSRGQGGYYFSVLFPDDLRRFVAHNPDRDPPMELPAEHFVPNKPT